MLEIQMGQDLTPLALNSALNSSVIKNEISCNSYKETK